MVFPSIAVSESVDFYVFSDKGIHTTFFRQILEILFIY